MNRRVVVGMSGGVDSSVAAYLLKKQGYEVIGLTFQVYDYSRENRKEGKGGCCSIEDVDDARVVAHKIGIRHYLVDTRPQFKDKVIQYFVDSYKSGETPNPCVACNTFIKFDELAYYAKLFDASWMATGHYARLVNEEGRVFIERSKNLAKDQSYFLMGVNPEYLPQLLFPIGDLSKEEVREFALEAGLCVTQKKESMEICFIPKNDYREFMAKEFSLEDREGDIVDEKTGQVLGRHSGAHHFTIGQRKGLGALGLDAHYVTRLDPAQNRVFVGDATRVFSSQMKIEIERFRDVDRFLNQPLQVKIRSRSQEVRARLTKINSQSALATFEEPQRAVTPGQFAVFYQGDRVLGGGAILEAYGLEARG